MASEGMRFSCLSFLVCCVSAPCLPSLLFSTEPPWGCHSLFCSTLLFSAVCWSATCRVLQPARVFLLVSIGRPSLRLPLLLDPHLEWDVSIWLLPLQKAALRNGVMSNSKYVCLSCFLWLVLLLLVCGSSLLPGGLAESERTGLYSTDLP